MVKLGTHPDSLELYHVYHDLAWMSYRQGYLEKSRGYCEGAQLVIKSMPRKSGPAVEQARADLAHLMALIDASSGQLESALANLENERQLRLRFDDPVRMSACYNKISSVLQAMGRIKQAFDYQRMTMDLALLTNDLFRQAVSHKNFGELYAIIGNHDRALEHYRRALDLSQAVDNQLGIIFANAGIGRIVATRGDVVRAEQHLQDALKLARRIKNREQEGSVLIDLAGLAAADKRPAHAARQLEAARTLTNELDQPSSPRQMIVAARLALSSSDNDDLVGTRSTLQQLLAGPITINDEEYCSIPELEADACCLLARVLRRFGCPDSTGPLRERAVAAIATLSRDLDDADRASLLARPLARDVFALSRE
ncbi:MAG TPA: tetratricopeptide repeat protein, partial [Candidatus Edwardsbacteria bacterium]|nr:tetratricopeptide repeat protein [Candidatus Edwardsbacteria bacterium]